MSRSILTGFFVLALSASSFAFAAAAETRPGPGPAGAITASPASEVTAPQEPETGPREGIPYLPPSPAEGAELTNVSDLATANAPPAMAPGTLNDGSAPHISRLRRFASGIVSRSTAIASSLTRSAMRFIGTPYVFGGTRSSGFDCSGYVQHVFAMLGMHLPRTADAQYDAGHRIAARMAPGDLVFFHTYAPGVSHVGIYLGNDKFIHSSSSHGVSIASLHDSYWAPRYLGAKRVFGQ